MADVLSHSFIHIGVDNLLHRLRVANELIDIFLFGLELGTPCCQLTMPGLPFLPYFGDILDRVCYETLSVLEFVQVLGQLHFLLGFGFQTLLQLLALKTQLVQLVVLLLG